MERTLILLKPDCVSSRNIGTVIARFESAGLTVRACKMIRPSANLLRSHYAHIADKPFYPEVEAFMQRSPIVALVLEGENCVASTREMLGVTDSLQAAPGTIRASLGSKDPKTSKMINVAHASDSLEAAGAEIARFFTPEEIFAW